MEQKKYSLPEVLTLTLILSFCSIIYELLLANTLGIMTGSYIWWQSITIGVYIGGLGLGSMMASKSQRPYEDLFRVEWILTLLGGLSVVFIYFLHGGYRTTDFLFYLHNEFYSPAYIQQNALLQILFLMGVETLTLLIGFFSGYEIPIMMKRVKGEHDNKILGFNYIGTLVGALAFAFILLPLFDVLVSSLVVATLNLCICLYLLMRNEVARSVLKVSSSVALAAMLGLVYVNAETIEQTYLKTYYMFKRYAATPDKTPLQFFEELDRFEDVERIKTKYQYIDIYKPEIVTDEVILAIDTNFQFSSYNEKFYHEGFAHIPISMTSAVPKRILVLGGGDGLLIRELVKYEGIKEILHIELDEVILEIAREREVFTKMNRRALEDPRVKTLVADGFYFLRNNTEKFDAIFIDFPYPNNYDLARLYSVEFYRFVKKSLHEHGFVVLDAPIHNQVRSLPTHLQNQVTVDSVFRERDRTSNSIILSTAYFAGFQQLFPYKVGEESFLLMTSSGKPFNYKIDEQHLSYYEVIESSHLREVMRQEFPHRIQQEFVNSIFRPRLLSGPSF